MGKGACGPLKTCCAKLSAIHMTLAYPDRLLTYPQSSHGCIARTGGMWANGPRRCRWKGTSTVPSARDGDEGSADEPMSVGDEDSGDCLTLSTDSASNFDEYEQFLSQLLGVDEPRHRNRHRG